MADAYWEFYREQSKILKDRKVKFDEPGGKVRFIAELWKKEKKNAETLAIIREEALKAEERAKAAEVGQEKAKKAWEDIKRIGDNKMMGAKK
jgi:hypothetical protein